MTKKECVKILKSMSYKRNFIFAVTESLDTVKLTIKAHIEDSDKVILSPNASMITVSFDLCIYPIQWNKPSEIIRLVKTAIRDFELHEVDEWLRYKGDRVSKPH